MPYVMKRFDKERVPLLGLDESGETWADIRHVKGGDRFKIDQIRVRPEYTYQLENGTTTVERMPVSEYMLQARTVWVCLIDTNLMDHEERKWFDPGVEWDAFVDACAR